MSPRVDLFRGPRGGPETTGALAGGTMLVIASADEELADLSFDRSKGVANAMIEDLRMAMKELEPKIEQIRRRL